MSLYNEVFKMIYYLFFIISQFLRMLSKYIKKTRG